MSTGGDVPKAPPKVPPLPRNEELARRRRLELDAVRAERDGLAAQIADLQAEVVERLTRLRQLDDRAGFLTGWLDARRLAP